MGLDQSLFISRHGFLLDVPLSFSDFSMVMISPFLPILNSSLQRVWPPTRPPLSQSRIVNSILIDSVLPQYPLLSRRLRDEVGNLSLLKAAQMGVWPLTKLVDG